MEVGGDDGDVVGTWDECVVEGAFVGEGDGFEVGIDEGEVEGRFEGDSDKSVVGS